MRIDDTLAAAIGRSLETIAVDMGATDVSAEYVRRVRDEIRKLWELAEVELGHNYMNALIADMGPAAKKLFSDLDELFNQLPGDSKQHVAE